MEEKIYSVKLYKNNIDRDVLFFSIGDKEFEIDLNSDEQTILRDLFYEVIKKCFSEKPKFELVYDEMVYTNKLFIEISNEYLQHLNSEIDVIINDIPNLQF